MRVTRLSDEFMARMPNSEGSELVLEIAAELAMIEQFIEALKPFNIKEIVRTGSVAIRVGD